MCLMITVNYGLRKAEHKLSVAYAYKDILRFSEEFMTESQIKSQNMDKCDVF